MIPRMIPGFAVARHGLIVGVSWILKGYKTRIKQGLNERKTSGSSGKIC